MQAVLKDKIYTDIKKLFEAYTPNMTLRESKNVSGKDSAELVKIGNFDFFGKKRKEAWFVGVTKQKDYVGFYFMPIYAEPKLAEKISQRLLKTLKGKSCFYIKTDDAEMMADIKHALAVGFECWKDRGWA